jgi:D-tagatose-1,6-bisphosphate aldolase subunit GatZ/KbaZ
MRMSDNAVNTFLDTLLANRNCFAKGVYSVCSSNREVLEACIRQAKDDNSIIVIESTSNQVDQFGGYTGMKPAGFASYAHSIAAGAGYPPENILLGGDHLGPNAWRHLPAEAAMNHASKLIEEYVKAGYRKIHIDTSMFCSDDAGDRLKALPDEVVASRTLQLCRVAENAREKYFGTATGLIYIVGTEVPVPGGAIYREEFVHPTKAEDAEETLRVLKRKFYDAGMNNAWERVSGLVVQPGVEFGDDQIFKYNRKNAKALSKLILRYDNLVYEAHSTDYQTETSLKEMVEDHFCILKVGPWLTFAFREALFALEAIEAEILGKDSPDLSKLSDTLDRVMVSNPKYWSSYYKGEEKEILFKRKFSFSDRSRYYWPLSELERSKEKLYGNLARHKIPLSVLSQFMPAQFSEVCEGRLSIDPIDLVYSHIRSVTGKYASACGFHSAKK